MQSVLSNPYVWNLVEYFSIIWNDKYVNKNFFPGPARAVYSALIGGWLRLPVSVSFLIINYQVQAAC